MPSSSRFWLQDKGILSRVSNVTDWCSPGFFVSKSDGRVRLVTDFTHLNRYVNRPVHPFPSTRDILQAIPHSTVYFLKMDAVHWYFQLTLSEESSLLTTFLLQQIEDVLRVVLDIKGWWFLTAVKKLYYQSFTKHIQEFPNICHCCSTVLLAGHEELHQDFSLFRQNMYQICPVTSQNPSNWNCTVSSQITNEWPRNRSIWRIGKKVASCRLPLFWLCMAFSATENYNCVSSRESGESFSGIWISKFDQVRRLPTIQVRICRILQGQEYFPQIVIAIQPQIK